MILRSRRCFWSVGLLPSLALAASLVAAEVLPQSQPLTRYAKMLEDSPFRKPTEAAPPAPPPPEPDNFGADLTVSGVMRSGEKNMVMLVQKSDSQRILVSSGEENAQGLSLVSVEFSEEHLKTRVTLKKGKETAVVTFDQNAARAVAPAPRAMPVPPRPQVPPPLGVTPLPVRPAIPPPVRTTAAPVRPTGPALTPSSPGMAPARPRFVPPVPPAKPGGR